MSTVEIFWGENPEVPSEKAFLEAISSELHRRGMHAFILANFYTDSSSRQVDFLIVTDDHVVHVELKNYDGVLSGGKNGQWTSAMSDGERRVIDRQNPYSQAVQCKMAISDDMHILANSNEQIPRPSGKFYTQFDSVVCVFPRLAPGSHVPSDYKARTLGYKELVEFALAPGKRPPWSQDQWLALIRQLGLVRAEPTTERNISLSESEDLVAAYRERLARFYRRELHELVPLSLRFADQVLPSTLLHRKLETIPYLQIVGPAGSGKTHLIKHVTLELLANDYVPIFVEAGAYEGRLSRLIERSIARFSTATFSVLSDAAQLTNSQVLLILDGCNECPPSLLEQLLGDLSAACLRMPTMKLLATSQSAISLPSTINAEAAYIEALSAEQRQAIVASYGAPEILDFCEPFSTSYELAIAAECSAEVRTRITRADLFAAFIRKRLSSTRSPGFTRDILRQLALVMDSRITTTLPLDDVWSIADRRLAERSGTPSITDEVFSCALVRIEQGRLAFTHELIGRFLALEELRIQNPTVQALMNELSKPRHADLRTMSVQLEQEPQRVCELLNKIADSSLYINALMGTLGHEAKRAVTFEAQKLLHEATHAMAEVEIRVGPRLDIAIHGTCELSSGDRAALAAVGAMVHRGDFFADTIRLLDATDRVCMKAADAWAGDDLRDEVVSAIVSAVYTGLISGGHRTAASIITESSRHAKHTFKWRKADGTPSEIATERLGECLETAHQGSYGRLLLLSLLLAMRDDISAAEMCPHLMRLAWESGAYHVRLEGLQTIQSFARLIEEHPVHQEIVDVLNTMHTDHFMLSSQLVETLDAYGLIEYPGDTSQITSAIDRILLDPTNQENARAAYIIVANQFEDVVAQPYLEAISALSHDQLTMLLVSAAIGSSVDNFWLDWILLELLERADSRSFPVFEYWTGEIKTDTPFKQQAYACFLLAIQGYALFCGDPPRLVKCQTRDELAWQHYAAIVFWLHRGEIDSVVAERCAPHWRSLQGDLLNASVDPIHWMIPRNITRGKGASVIQRLIELFPSELRNILEWGFLHREELSSIDSFSDPDRIFSIIQLLEYVGNEETVSILRQYADDPSLGRSVISTIKRLTTGHET
ncbi:NERD domain-containing protein [Nonomuraea helvata]|uniref:NERD domain-containing protein n=1 Tax=Nonomuraea helvata TaxID=37484 RepID=A0ABV5RTC5_9ACTN